MALQQSELLVVEHQTGLDGVAVVLALHVDKLGAEVADVRPFEGHVADGHVGHDADVLVAVYHDMVVAVELARKLRQVGQHRRHLSQVDAVERDGEVL